jgi:hypothetical protein
MMIAILLDGGLVQGFPNLGIRLAIQLENLRQNTQKLPLSFVV